MEKSCCGPGYASPAEAIKAPREKLVVVQIEQTGSDANGGEPVFLTDGTPVGTTPLVCSRRRGASLSTAWA